uniref:Non-structural maintenance of chromosomes element 4 n=1 Tax=Photinus pyralis TaxID=7054 RepID=A0A1Y1N8M7_PHOPY
MSSSQENNGDSKKQSHIRKQGYRELLHRIESIEENEGTGLNTIKDLGEVLHEVKQIDDQCPFVNRVEFLDETLLQHVVLSTAGGLLVKCIENVDIFTSTYEPTEFASKIIDEIKETENFKPSDLLNLLDDARKTIPSVSDYSFLYGTFDPTKLPEPKQKKERSKREAQESVQKTQLERVHNLQKDEEGVDDTVNFIANVLSLKYKENNNNPIAYFDFVIDSEDFGATIENIFYTSFLVRDGKAKLNSEGNIPFIEPVRKSNLKAFRGSGGKNSQMIPSITMDDWEVKSLFLFYR